MDFAIYIEDPVGDPPVVDESGSGRIRDNEIIANIELTAGVTWMPWQDTSFTAGYRVDYWDGLLSGFNLGGDSGSQTFHGPFLKLEVKL